MLVQEDFAQLEKIAQQNQIEKGRLLGGVWKTSAFYNGHRKATFGGNTHRFRLRLANCQGEKVYCGLSRVPDTPDFSGLSLSELFVAGARFRALPTVYLNLNGVYSRVVTRKRKRYFSRPAALKEKELFWYQAMHQQHSFLWHLKHRLTKLLPQSLPWTWKFGMRKALSAILVTGQCSLDVPGMWQVRDSQKTRGSRVSVKCFEGTSCP